MIAALLRTPLILIKVGVKAQSPLDWQQDKTVTSPEAPLLAYDVYEVRRLEGDSFLYLNARLELAIFHNPEFQDALKKMWRPRVYHHRTEQGLSIRVRTAQSLNFAPDVTELSPHQIK